LVSGTAENDRQFRPRSLAHFKQSNHSGATKSRVVLNRLTTKFLIVYCFGIGGGGKRHVTAQVEMGPKESMI